MSPIFTWEDRQAAVQVAALDSPVVELDSPVLELDIRVAGLDSLVAEVDRAASAECRVEDSQF